MKNTFNEATKRAKAYGPVITEKAGKLYESTATGAAKPSGLNITRLAVCTEVGGTGGLMVAAPAVVAAPLFASTGFTVSGVHATSIGAAIHSTIGNVVTSSLFAILQSAGGAGHGLPLVEGAIQVTDAMVSAVSASMAYFTSSQNSRTNCP